ncbi:MAG: hypothetical protein ACREPN_04910 [Rudaea sp.]
MRANLVMLLSASVLLAACGSSRSDKGAAACNTEIAKRMNGKSFALDLKDLAAHAKAESADTVLFTSTLILDKGLATEDKQTYECRVRFDANGAPSVLYLQFNWNTADLKRAQ